MREIIYRCWDKAEDKFAYSNEMFDDYEFVFENNTIVCRKRYDYCDKWGDDHTDWEILDCEVEQYTGLKDKIGNKVFEGDIVVFHNTLTLIGYFEGKIKYYDNCKPIISKNNTHTHIDLAECDSAELSVIGNIHDKD